MSMQVTRRAAAASQAGSTSSSNTSSIITSSSNCHALQQHSSSSSSSSSSSRRQVLVLGGSVAAVAAVVCGGAAAGLAVPPAARAEQANVLVEQAAPPAAQAAARSQLQLYANTAQVYSLRVPPDWERKEKAGADVLFEDPRRRSTSVGVTVSPVRVTSIDKFGDLAAVGQRLLDAERKKESTLGVELLASSSRQAASGALLYDYEYELASTRGTKRILNTVTITGSKLYILNGNYKCDKEAGCGVPEAAGSLTLLRAIAGSFDAGAAGSSS